MKQLIQSTVLGLCFSGLALAGSNSAPSSTKGTSQQSGSTTSGINKGSNSKPSNAAPINGKSGMTNKAGVPLNTNSVDPNSTIKNTDIRTSGSIAPNGTGVAENGVISHSTLGSTQIKGTVETVDQSGNRVRVRDSQGNIKEYTINNKTEFLNNQKKSVFSDVKSGDSVTFDVNKDNQNIQKFEIDGRRQTLKK